MGKLSSYARNRIVALKSCGTSDAKIKEILEEEGIKTSRSAVNLFMSRYRRTGSIADARRTGRKPSLKEQHLQFIDDEMKANDELTSFELKKKLSDEHEMDVSTSTIRRVRRAMGWKHERARYCQMIREPNKLKRLSFCIKALEEKDTFDNVIFTDETSVEIERHTRLCFRKNGSAPNRKGRPKHPLKVHVWAGISKLGATQVCVFTGKMDSLGYQMILERNLLPFITATYPNGHRLWQDNDPKHTSNSTKKWFQDNGVNHWATPPESPDLNPIENLWANLKHHIRKYVKPDTKEELIAGIQAYWNTLSAETCKRYVEHVHKVIPAVVASEGGPSGY